MSRFQTYSWGSFVNSMTLKVRDGVRDCCDGIVVIHRRISRLIELRFDVQHEVTPPLMILMQYDEINFDCHVDRRVLDKFPQQIAPAETQFPFAP